MAAIEYLGDLGELVSIWVLFRFTAAFKFYTTLLVTPGILGSLTFFGRTSTFRIC
jgi:hypothetical protein